jgi:hypothetical protein
MIRIDGKDTYIVYADWNIFDDITKSRQNELDKVVALAKEKKSIICPYSIIHLHEASNVDLTIPDGDKLVDINYNSIRSFSDFWHIENADASDLRVRRVDPSEILDPPLARSFITSFENAIAPIMEGIAIVRQNAKDHGLDSKVLNNTSSKNFISRVDDILVSQENLAEYRHLAPEGLTFDDLLVLGSKIAGTNAHQELVLVYVLSDLTGYHSDRVADLKSLWRDASHVAFARGADVLISSDKRLRQKATLTYEKLGWPTIVLDAVDAAKLIEQIP